MSRIGKAIIEVPPKVEVKIEANQIRVKGPKGELHHSIPAHLQVKLDGKTLLVIRDQEDKATRSLHGLIRMKISNMVKGVTDGFEKKLEIIGVGYRAQKKGKELEMSLGFSHPVIFPCPPGIEYVLEGQTSIFVKGMDKVVVGQMAADLKALRPAEPYKGKGIRYAGEIIRRKAGKAGKVGAKK
jgi:large subunit ribosomal protein L6